MADPPNIAEYVADPPVAPVKGPLILTENVVITTGTKAGLAIVLLVPKPSGPVPAALVKPVTAGVRVTTLVPV